MSSAGACNMLDVWEVKGISRDVTARRTAADSNLSYSEEIMYVQTLLKKNEACLYFADSEKYTIRESSIRIIIRDFLETF